LRARLDPFVLSQTIDRKLERIFALASPTVPLVALPSVAVPSAVPSLPRPTRRRAGYKPNFFRRRDPSSSRSRRRSPVTSQTAR
jgi:hypothetical protein